MHIRISQCHVGTVNFKVLRLFGKPEECVWNSTITRFESTNLWEAWGSRVWVGSRVTHWRVHGALPFLLVDAVSLTLWQVEEVLHRFQIDQQGLRCCAGVLLLPQDLWEQALFVQRRQQHRQLRQYVASPWVLESIHSTFIFCIHSFHIHSAVAAVLNLGQRCYAWWKYSSLNCNKGYPSFYLQWLNYWGLLYFPPSVNTSLIQDLFRIISVRFCAGRMHPVHVPSCEQWDHYWQRSLLGPSSSCPSIFDQLHKSQMLLTLVCKWLFLISSMLFLLTRWV